MDENGDNWTKDGLFVLDESPKWSLMDLVERSCNGEEIDVDDFIKHAREAGECGDGEDDKDESVN